MLTLAALIQVVHRIHEWMEEKLQTFFKRDTECQNHNIWMISCMLIWCCCCWFWFCLFVFFLWLLSYNSICPLLFGLHVHLKIHHFYLLNQPNEGKWKEKYIIMSLWLWYITFLLWCKRDEICNQKSFFIKNRLNCF